MSTQTHTDVETWIVDSDTCDIPGCCRSPIIIAGGGWHDKFCELHIAPAADLAGHFPAFPGWYRVECITTGTHGRVIVLVHPLG